MFQQGEIEMWGCWPNGGWLG